MSGLSGSNPIVSRIESVFPYKHCPPTLPPPPSSHHFTYSCLLFFLMLKIKPVSYTQMTLPPNREV